VILLIISIKCRLAIKLYPRMKILLFANNMPSICITKNYLRIADIYSLIGYIKKMKINSYGVKDYSCQKNVQLLKRDECFLCW
jgi:hypothetical protein